MAKRIVDEEMRFSIVVNGDPAQKELHQLDKATKELTSSNSKLRTEKRRLERQNKTSSARYKEVTAELNKNTKAIQGNNARMNQLEKNLGVTNLTMAQLQKRATALRLAIRHSVPDAPGTKKLKAELQEVSLQMRKVRMESTGMRAGIGKVADGFSRFAALGATMVAALTGVVFSIQRFIDFNGELADAQANVQKTTGLTKREVDDLAKSFGALKTRSSRLELLKLSEEAGRLGIRGVANIKAFTEIADRMNVALGDDLSTEQIREVGKATKIFKVGEKNGLSFAKAMESLGSAINFVSASGANQADFLVDFLKRTAGVGDIANISAEDIVGLAAAFDELGQTQEVSATAINKTFISMGQNVEKFANVANVSVGEFSRLLEEDANEAMITFLNGLNRGNPSLEEMAKRLQGIEVGGTRGIQALSALAGNVDLLRRRQEQASTALRENTSLQEEFNLKNENFAAILERIRKRLNGILTSAQTFIEPLVRGFAELIGVTEKESDALVRQQTELNALRFKIFDVNTTNEDRIKLINELKTEYPQLLANIDAETVSNYELEQAIEKVNEQLVNRILLQRQQEEIDDQAADTADELEDKLERQNQLRQKAGEIIQRYPGFALDDTKTELENIQALRDFILANKETSQGNVFSQDTRDVNIIEKMLKFLQMEEEIYQKEVEKGNELLTERQQLLKDLGIEENTGKESYESAKKYVPLLGSFLDLYLDKQILKEKEIKAEREALQLEELNSLDFLNEEKVSRLDRLKKEELAIEKHHLHEVEQMLKNMLSTLNLDTADFSILTDEQVEDVKQKLIEIGYAAQQAETFIKALQGKGEGLTDQEASVDILGFTAGQWVQTFENLDTTAAKLQAVGMAVQAASQMYQMFTQNRALQDQREFEQFMQQNEAKKDALDRRLSNGLINERQHREQLKALEQEEEKRRAKLQYEQAKREKEILLAQTISQVAFNVAKVIAQPWLAAIVASLGAIQIAQVARQPLPAKGYEQGFYGNTFPVERQQDGKIFNAGFGGMSRSGIVDQPTVFLAGEQGRKSPEMIINGEDYANFAPDFRQSLNRELARVKGFESGFMSQSSETATQNDQMTANLIALLTENRALLSVLVDEGINANVIANETNARELQEALEKFKKRKQSAQI